MRTTDKPTSLTWLHSAAIILAAIGCAFNSLSIMHLRAVDKTTQGVVVLHTQQIGELRDAMRAEYISTDAPEASEPPLTNQAPAGDGDVPPLKEGEPVIVRAKSNDSGRTCRAEQFPSGDWMLTWEDTHDRFVLPEENFKESFTVIEQDYGKIFDGHLIRKLPHPIEHIEKATEHAASGAFWLAVAGLGACVGFPFLLIVLALVRKRPAASVVNVYQPPGGKP